MPEEHKQRIGCGGVFAIALVVALAAAGIAAWGLGYIDRVMYLVSLEQQAAELQDSPEAATAPLAATVAAAAAAAEQAAAEPAPYYVYSQLSDEDKDKYRIVLDAIVSREERPYPTDDMSDLTRIRDCVFADHPELFYVNGMSMHTTTNTGSGLVTKVAVSAQYTCTPDEQAAIEEQVEAAAAECLAELPAGADDYEKAKFLYEYLAKTVSYERIEVDAAVGGGASPDQTVEGALVQRRAVCSGYASAYQYLLQQLGVSCTYLFGQAIGENHAWCLAQLNGAYYFVDPTWGDPQFAGDAQEFANQGLDQGAVVNYDYLCVTTADIEVEHVLDVPFSVPECTATADNYYVREGLLFAWDDVDRLGNLAADALGSGQTLQVRCADADVYEALYAAIEDGRIADYLPVSRYWYTRFDPLHSILLAPC